jgi:hypothetical protein
MIITRSVLLRIGNVSDKSSENQNTHFMFNNCFPENGAVYDIMWGKHVRAAGHITIQYGACALHAG